MWYIQRGNLFLLISHSMLYKCTTIPCIKHEEKDEKTYFVLTVKQKIHKVKLWLAFTAAVNKALIGGSFFPKLYKVQQIKKNIWHKCSLTHNAKKWLVLE